MRRCTLFLASFVLVGCAGDKETPTDSGETTTTTTTTKPTTETGTEETGTPTDTTPPEPRCLQELVAFGGQVDYVEDDATLDADTLAVTTGAPAPAVALPKGLVDAPYYGAVDPAAATPWWRGWTFIDTYLEGSLPAPGAIPIFDDIQSGDLQGADVSQCKKLGYEDAVPEVVAAESFPVCVVSGDILADVTWPSDHIFVLTETVRVGNGDQRLQGGVPSQTATLTIEPGTQIYVAPGDHGLVITRGSQIVANGTAELPILFSAAAGSIKGIVDNVFDFSSRGAWRGLILQGFAVNHDNNNDNEATSAYLPDSWHGGTNDADSSGSLQYVVIAEAGQSAGGMGRRYPGLTLEGVGSGTTIDYLQVLGADGDCLGVFGGTAPVTHFVCSGAGDDSIDVDSGNRGIYQFGIVRQGATVGDAGIEADGGGNDGSREPFTAPLYANLTILGNTGNDGGFNADSVGALHRSGARGQMYRSVIMDDTAVGGAFDDGCFDLDDLAPAELQYRDVLFACSEGSLAPCDEGLP